MRIGTLNLWVTCSLTLLLTSSVWAQQQEIFEGVVLGTNPFKVRSLEGVDLQFQPKTRLSGRIKKEVYVEVPYTDGEQPYPSDPPKILGGTFHGIVKEIAADKSYLVITIKKKDNPNEAKDNPNEAEVPLQTATQFQPLVAAMHPGDAITAVYLTNKNQRIKSVVSLKWQSASVPIEVRLGTLGIAAVLLLGLAVIATSGDPLSLLVGDDNRYSNSQFQFWLWFWLLISAYGAAVWLRISHAGWSYGRSVSIPQNLLVLSGISALTFAGAYAITGGKIDRARQRGVIAKPRAAAPRLSNLVQDDRNRTDLGDFQMLVITLLSFILYAITLVVFLERIEFRSQVTLPDVDGTLLALFGIGQAAYLGKKQAEPAPGLTPEQAILTAAEAAAAAQTAADNAAAARKEAETKAQDAEKAAQEATSQARQTLARPKLEEALEARQEASEAAARAEAALNTAQALAKDANALAEAWSGEPLVAQAALASAQLAGLEVSKAQNHLVSATAAASSARTIAGNAAKAVAKMTP